MMQVPAERLRRVATALFRAVGRPDDVTRTVVEAQSKQRRGAEGVPLPEATWEALKRAGSDLGVDVEAVR